ncbi:MAG TPA: DDE-type integrase/transposase/recombinase [Lacipirellulaceae bacterium]|nr:DDE-type integrase/transposase/recombinase [Lacipirellulaceae bacterium]
MNKLGTKERARILHCLVEGTSMRATARLTGVSINTVVKLLRDAGRACSAYQDRTLRGLRLKRLQCDEIWSFVGCKERNATPDHKRAGLGDCWTWTAIDADTKLIPCWYVGTRDASAAYHFIHDLKDRLATRVQLTTDGHRAYLAAVEDAFGGDVDFAQLVKIYGATPEGPEVRYSPAQCMGARKALVTGSPDYRHVSTSFAERANLSMRMGMRRFTRLTNAFSKKVEQHENALALYFMFYNFARIHQTLRVTPAMEAGVSDHVWSMEEIVEMMDRDSN